MARRLNGVARSAAGIGAAAALSRCIGAVRVLTVAAVLGTTYLGNAFQGANTVSNLLFELLAAGALSAVLVPTFVGLFDAGDRDGADQLGGELLGAAVVLLGAVTLVGVLAAPLLSGLLTSAVADPEVRAAQSRLTTVLLWFFLPQVLLYALGSVATAILQAQRRFVIPALAPIGNTVAMVALLLVFRVVAGADPGLELSGLEMTLLGLAGTLGVVAFVGAPAVAVWRSGIGLRPRFRWRHEAFRKVVAMSGWATLQHGFAALLLGGAIIAGGSVAGGVVAYQVGWYFFLAPYGIIAQPLHTAILPEMVGERADGGDKSLEASARWALDSMAVLLVPLTAFGVALAEPAMQLLAFGGASDEAGIDLLTAALASLTLGLLPYGAFFLLTRVWYVLEDSRVPAAAGGIAAIVGLAVMGVGASLTDGAATVLWLGLGHTAGFVAGVLWMVVRLRRRAGIWAVPTLLGRVVAVSVPLGVAAAVLARRWAPTGRGSALALLLAIGVPGLLCYAGGIRCLGVSLTDRVPRRGAAG